MTCLATVDQVDRLLQGRSPASGRREPDGDLPPLGPGCDAGGHREEEIAGVPGAIDTHAVTEHGNRQLARCAEMKAIWALDGRAARRPGPRRSSTRSRPTPRSPRTTPSRRGSQRRSFGISLSRGHSERLDAGVLDVGVVRDSTLDATNDSELFSEVFEGVAFRGVEALTIISPFLPTGGFGCDGRHPHLHRGLMGAGGDVRQRRGPGRLRES